MEDSRILPDSLTDQSTLDEINSLLAMDPEPSQPESSTTSSQESKVAVSTTKMTDVERRQLRAKKFNVPLAEGDRKKARAERFGGSAPSTGTGTTTRSTSVASMSTPVSSVEGAEKLKKRAERFGAVSKTMQVEELNEKLLTRQKRFGAANEKQEVAMRKKLRAERFGATTV